VGDIRIVEPKIHACTKYMDQLVTKFFPDAKFQESKRMVKGWEKSHPGK